MSVAEFFAETADLVVDCFGKIFVLDILTISECTS